MSRTEMIAAVVRLQTGDCTIGELDTSLAELKAALPGSGISDLIYWPDADRTAEQIVDEALRRQREGVIRL